MADLNNLKLPFNIKNLDVAQIIRIASDYLNSLIKIGLIVGTLLIAGLMFNDYHIKDQALHIRMSQIKQKLDAIKARDKAIQELNKFKSSLPKKINEFEIIALISKYAKSCHISIPSLSPGESKDMGLYDIINVSFNGETGAFKDIVLFLKKIETSEVPLRIDSWSGHKAVDEETYFDIVISAVLIHP